MNALGLGMSVRQPEMRAGKQRREPDALSGPASL
jgi:hypothetical protein